MRVRTRQASTACDYLANRSSPPAAKLSRSLPWGSHFAASHALCLLLITAASRCFENSVEHRVGVFSFLQYPFALPGPWISDHDSYQLRSRRGVAINNCRGNHCVTDVGSWVCAAKDYGSVLLEGFDEKAQRWRPIAQLTGNVHGPLRCRILTTKGQEVRSASRLVDTSSEQFSDDGFLRKTDLLG